MTDIVAVGAGRALMAQPDDMLHQWTLDLTGKSCPNIGFIPTASGDNPGYIDDFYTVYAAKQCVPSHLQLFYRHEKDVRAWVLQQDILHVGGGNTANMLAVWQLHGLDRALLDAAAAGKVLCGGSAGAICWFDGGVTDSFGDSALSPLTGGLGLIEGSLCPHYDGDTLRAPAYHRMLQEESLPAGYAADDQVALHFRNGQLTQAVTSRAGGSAYWVEKTPDGTIKEFQLAVDVL